MPLRILLALTVWLAIPSVSRAEVTAEQVREAIAGGIKFLKSQQSKTKGSWPDSPGLPGGVTSLATLALIEAGEPVDSPVIQKSLDYLRKLSDPKMTYCAALQIMAMDIRAVDKVEPLTLMRAQPEEHHTALQRLACGWDDRGQVHGLGGCLQCGADGHGLGECRRQLALAVHEGHCGRRRGPVWHANPGPGRRHV